MEKRDFSDINTIVKKILRATYFPKKDKIKGEEWHLASGKAVKVSDFVKKICISNNYKQKIILKKNRHKEFHHISDKKSIW